MRVEDKSRPNAFGHFEAFYNCGLQEAAAVDAARTVGMPPQRGDGGEFDGPSWALYRYWLSQDPAFRYAPSGMPIGSVFHGTGMRTRLTVCAYFRKRPARAPGAIAVPAGSPSACFVPGRVYPAPGRSQLGTAARV